MSSRHERDFSLNLKIDLRNEKLEEDDLLKNTVVEIDHILPRYLGGTNDPSNAEALTRPQHAFKHFLGTYFPEPEGNTNAEWWAVRQIVGRMSKEEFAQFALDIAPVAESLEDWLKDKGL